MELVGTSAVVVGGTQGIGLSIAQRLVSHAAGVVVLGRDEDRVRSAVQQIEGRAVGVSGSVTSAADVERALDAAAEAFGTPQILVNSAGAGALTPVVDMAEEDWETVFDVCAKGTFLSTKAFAGRLLKEQLPGAIVNISSLNAFAATDGIGAYAAAKAAVAQFTKVAAAELAPAGIRVNAVAPGITRTPMAEGFLSGRMLAEFLAHTPLGRVGEPDDIAKVVAFLCSDYADWITGVTLPVDGGAHIRGLHNYWAVAQEAG